jgi:hypothetical protein
MPTLPDPSTGVVREHPFRHVVYQDPPLLTAAEVSELLAAFPGPDVLGAHSRTNGSDKTYQANMASLHDMRGWSPAAARLAPCWRELVRELVESAYGRRLADHLGIPPGPVTLELRLTEYLEGGWMSRHTDRPDKLFSQNIYLCPRWLPEWGGELALYTDESDEDPSSVFVPGAGTSLAFARSDRSWHEVMPVSAAAAVPRRALLVHGFRCATS